MQTALKLFIISISLAVIPKAGIAATAKLKSDTIGCRSIGTFSLADSYYEQGDSVAAQEVVRSQAKKGNCRILKKGTTVYFHHPIYVTDGDYGSRTTIRPSGETDPWVIDKCSLDGRDPDLARFPGYSLPEKSCDKEAVHD